MRNAVRSIVPNLLWLVLVAFQPNSTFASEDHRQTDPYSPVSAIDDQRLLLAYLVSWLSDDLADAHRVYPVRGDVKNISVGEGYSIIGEKTFILSPEKRVVRRDSKEREYSVQDRKRHDVLISVEYQFDNATGHLESRVHCNGRFFERHVYEMDTAGGTVIRFSYYPNGRREPTPTMIFIYDSEKRTLSKERLYIGHDGICDPNWSMPEDPQSVHTTFVFGASGFVTDIISGNDPTDKNYLHWRFVEDNNGDLKDTILMPETHQYRRKVVEYDSYGNPTVVHTLVAVNSFGTIDFEYYGDDVFRREFFGK